MSAYTKDFFDRTLKRSPETKAENYNQAASNTKIPAHLRSDL